MSRGGPATASLLAFAIGCANAEEYPLEEGEWSRLITDVENQPPDCEDLGLTCFDVGASDGATVYLGGVRAVVYFTLPPGHVKEFTTRGERDEYVQLDTGETVLPATFSFSFTVSEDRKSANVEERIDVTGLACDPDDPNSTVCAYTMLEKWTWSLPPEPRVD